MSQRADIDDKGPPAPNAMLGGSMKKTTLVILLIILVAVLCELHGFKRGFGQGEKATNAWWIGQKSVMYDTSEVVKKGILNRCNRI